MLFCPLQSFSAMQFQFTRRGRNIRSLESVLLWKRFNATNTNQDIPSRPALVQLLAPIDTIDTRIRSHRKVPCEKLVEERTKGLYTLSRRLTQSLISNASPCGEIKQDLRVGGIFECTRAALQEMAVHGGSRPCISNQNTKPCYGWWTAQFVRRN
jgi:hypothetical protein